MFSSNNGLFRGRKKRAAAVAAAGTAALLVPTSIELGALARILWIASNALDAAQRAYDATRLAIDNLYELIREYEQRIWDLACAENGYRAFNADIFRLLERLADADPSVRLAILQLVFATDYSDAPQYTRRLSYEVLEYIYRYRCDVM